MPKFRHRSLHDGHVEFEARVDELTGNLHLLLDDILVLVIDGYTGTTFLRKLTDDEFNRLGRADIAVNTETRTINYGGRRIC